MIGGGGGGGGGGRTLDWVLFPPFPISGQIATRCARSLRLVECVQQQHPLPGSYNNAADG